MVKQAMKLLQSRIEIVPGRRAQMPPAQGVVGPGSAILRLVNTTGQENAYTVRLRCDSNPYWQEDWYALRAQDAALDTPRPGGNPVSATNKPDQYGPGHRWVRVFVSAGATRDVVLLFDLPQKPDSRAGEYPFVVSVETHVPDAAAATAASSRRRRFLDLPAVAVVRPYHAWEIDIAPEEQRVGLMKRGAAFEIVVTNTGNDWLYCDLKLPRPKDLLLASPTARIAVPPPEPGEENCQRVIPIHASSRLRQIRGMPQVQTLALSALRVDAPSVAPLAEDLIFAADMAVLPTSSVVAVSTSDTRQVPSERGLVYRPPIPATLTGFLGAASQNFKGLVLTVIGLIVAVNLGIFMFENLWRGTIMAEPLSTTASKEKPLVIGGKFLNGARVYADVGDRRLQPVDGRFGKPKDVDDNAVRGEAKTLLAALAPAERQFLSVNLKDFDGKTVFLTVQRAGVLPYLGPLLPRYRCKTSVLVGKPTIVLTDPRPTTGGALPRGAAFTIFDPRRALGSRAGTVQLGGEQAVVAEWTPEKIRARVPAPDGVLRVQVALSDGRTFEAGSITVVPTQVAKADDSTSQAAEQQRKQAEQEQARREQQLREQAKQEQAKQEQTIRDQQQKEQQEKLRQQQQQGSQQEQEQQKQREQQARAQQEKLAREQKQQRDQQTREQQGQARREQQQEKQQKHEQQQKQAEQEKARREQAQREQAQREQAQREQAQREQQQRDNQVKKDNPLRNQRDAQQRQSADLKAQIDADQAAWQKDDSALDERKIKMDETFTRIQTEGSRVDRTNAEAVAAYNKKVIQFQKERRQYNDDVREHDAVRARINQKIRDYNEMNRALDDLNDRLRRAGNG